jgi:hypothetical protein
MGWGGRRRASAEWIVPGIRAWLRAKRSNPSRRRKNDCFVVSLLAMTENPDKRPLSRSTFARAFAINFPPSEDQGAGNAGRPMRPQPCVQSEIGRKRVTTVTPETPGIPRAAVLTAYFVLPAAGRWRASNAARCRALCRQTTSQHARTRGVANGDGSPAIGGRRP